MVYNRFERSTFSGLRLCRRYLTGEIPWGSSDWAAPAGGKTSTSSKKTAIPLEQRHPIEPKVLRS